MTSSNVVLLDQEYKIKEFADRAFDEGAFVFDFESMGDNRGVCHLNRLNWVSLATRGMTLVVPFGHPIGEITGEHFDRKQYGGDGPKAGMWYNAKVLDYSPPPPQLAPETVFELLEPLFFSDLTKIAQGAVFDLASARKYYPDPIPGPYLCTIVMDWLNNENRKQYKLKVRTKEELGFAYDDEEVGKCIEKYPFNTVAFYSYCDAKYPWLMCQDYLAGIKAWGLEDVLALEMDVLGVLVGMRLRGSRVDVPRLEALAEELKPRREEVRQNVYEAAGRPFNLNSVPQLQSILYKPVSEGGQGLTGFKLTDAAKKKVENGATPDHTFWSTSKDTLEFYENNPVVKEFREYREVDKLLSTYIYGYLGDGEERECRIYDSRIYADFVQYGTTTGRFSCVSGDTLLETSRGVFRFDEYMPQQYDQVPTHTGEWGKVLRKIYRGSSTMFRVSLYNGATIKCTAEHRMQTSEGWKYVGDLRPGDKVLSYDGFQEVYNQYRKDTASPGIVLRESGEAYYPPSSRAYGYDLSQRPCSFEGTAFIRNIKERTKPALLSLEDARQESDARTEWFPASQLQGSNLRWEGLSSDQGWLGVHPFASTRNGESTGDEEVTSLAGCSPYRRGPLQQRYRQLSSGNYVWSWEAALQEVEIREIASLGTMGVWDIEVEGDHSYVTQGFLNHNCREPNLQNIPRPDTDLGKLIRGAWIADPGWKLVVADYGQIELAMFAHFCGQGALFDGFWEGIDPHTMTASVILNKDPSRVTPHERQTYGKTMNFAMVFGAGMRKVAAMLNCSEQRAKRVLKDHRHGMPEVYQLKEGIVSLCKQRDPCHVRTMSGRVRRLPGIRSKDDGKRMYAERQAVSSVIQGSAADLQKWAMVRAGKALTEHHLDDDAFLSLCVHDELVTECREDKVDEVSALIKEAMMGQWMQDKMSVPLSVDVKVVDRWSEAK